MAAAVLFGALVLQTEFAHALTFRGAQPSLVLIAIVWYALRSGMRNAAIFGLCAGLCEDALGAQTGGAWTIASTLTAIGACALTRWMFADSAPILGLLVFCATLLRRMIFWVVMALQGYPPGYARLHLHEALWEALLNAILAVLLLLCMRRRARGA